MTMILAFPQMAPLGKAIADKLGADFANIELHYFPDGESLVTLPEGIAGRDIALLASLRNPDAIALPLRFAAATAFELGARRVGLIAPYLAYMRQDQRFAQGQAISAPLFARFLNESFDWLVTVDPHLHRIASLASIFEIPAIRIPAAPMLAKWIAENVSDPVLVGPDSESRQWVSEVASLVGCRFEVLEKRRSGDRSVEFSNAPMAAIEGTPVILDDIASSGGTLVRAVEHLTKAGARAPVCVVIHAVFDGSAQTDILAAGAARVVATDSIPHPSNAIPLAGAIARSLRDLCAGNPAINGKSNR